jgi:hypothetical protein
MRNPISMERQWNLSIANNARQLWQLKSFMAEKDLDFIAFQLSAMIRWSWLTN